MNKPVITLYNWTLDLLDNGYSISGIADNHPELGKMVFISRTSKLVKSSLDEDIFTYETQNSIYKCALKYINLNSYCNYVDSFVKEMYEKTKDGDDIKDKIINALLENKLHYKKNKLYKHIEELAIEGNKEYTKILDDINNELINKCVELGTSIFIEVTNITNGDKLAFNIEGKTGIIKPFIHLGMIQDSIVYDDYGIDFRYLPSISDDFCMQTYHISDNIKSIGIHNSTGCTMQFNDINILPDETKVITEFKRN